MSTTTTQQRPLRITSGKGFHMEFANGWMVSVQFGAGNYCQNRDAEFDNDIATGRKGASNAECAVFSPDGEMAQLEGWDDTVKGWMSPDEIAELITWTQSQPV